MFIDQIALYNFRVYHGNNKLNLSIDTDKNISIIAGNNGFGKTSFLTSLVWGLYGRLMVDVDERYKQEINESGGYKRYCEKLMNRLALSESIEAVRILDDKIQDKYVSIARKEELKKEKACYTSFSVKLRFSGLMLPSVQCECLEITREYNVANHQEQVEILIDGKLNELTKGVGSEIFINDFILPKEIAKFFFFDAEKIVSLAEINTTEEKQYLSQAYAEVLGIKKYTDLKANLVNLRLRLRKNSAIKTDRDALEKLTKQLDQSRKLVNIYAQKIQEIEDKLLSDKLSSDRYQEKLIREGSSITVDDLKRFRDQKNLYSQELARIKVRFNDMLELAPFAMLAGKMATIKEQIEAEMTNSTASRLLLENKYNLIRDALAKHQIYVGIDKNIQEKLLGLIRKSLLPEEQIAVKTLLDFTADQQNKFFAVYDNLKNAYSRNFRQLITDQKRVQTMYANLQRKIQDAESKENDPVIAELRQSKEKVNEQISRLENELEGILAKKHQYETEVQVFSRQISELSRKVQLEDNDKEKDDVTVRLIEKLDLFILQLKKKKKISLESNILRELNRLMHKDDFVSKVNVVLNGDLIDIELYDHQGLFIDKELLSKGEQQLYATALLKALVDESNIRFPVFIDSPLQKFDKQHSRNIIKEFYPHLSSQVVLFPLLHKELNEDEYAWMQERVGRAYLIKQAGMYHSTFNAIAPENLFSAQNETQYVQ